uniref:Galactose-1-phosphate uridyl transferase N-terminal domain-containing protein n=1 Tax=Kalanchoe fedtschenkoi TaxID=63787 RepID=A0A7N0VFH9_KALFE
MATPARNPELRRDTVTGRWVIFSPARSKRPSDFKSKSPNPTPNPDQQCPFCIGHEHECAPEIFRLPAPPPPPSPASDWSVRVIQNLYPALSRDLDESGIKNPNPNSADPPQSATSIAGFGFHDVVIETPFHPVQLSDLSAEGIGEVVSAYKQRIDQIVKHDAIEYVQVFKNHGASAGASMSHSHSQIMALPVVPPLVVSRVASMKEFQAKFGACSVCKMIDECGGAGLVFHQSKHYAAVVPYAATFAFEVWIVPLSHASHLQEMGKEEAVDFGGLLKLVLKKIAKQLNDPPYNFMFHTATVKAGVDELASVHWFLQIVPQLSVAAGFEIATGCYINPVFPEDAARVLREVEVETYG